MNILRQFLPEPTVVCIVHMIKENKEREWSVELLDLDVYSFLFSLQQIWSLFYYAGPKNRKHDLFIIFIKFNLNHEIDLF